MRLRRFFPAIGALLFVMFTGGCGLSPTVLPEAPVTCGDCDSLPDGYRIEEYISGLDRPIGLAWQSDDRLLVSQQGGVIRSVTGGDLDSDPWAMIPLVRALSQVGLIGIATDPADTDTVYVYFEELPESAVDLPRQILLQIKRTDDGTTEAVRLFDDIAGSALEVNMGGMVHFGPGGELFVGVGDAGLEAAATEKTNIAYGKILRLDKDGRPAADNPLSDVPGADDRIFALGFEGAWDFTFNEETGTLYSVGGMQEGVRVMTYKETDPVTPQATPNPAALRLTTTYEMTIENERGDFGRGIEYYDSPQLAAFDGDLIACLGSSGLWHFDMEGNGFRISGATHLYPQCTGDVATGPDGFIYFVDSLGGRVYRIVSEAQEAGL